MVSTIRKQPNFNEKVENAIPALDAFRSTCLWRDRNSSRLRKIVSSIKFAGCAIFALVDAIASLSLAILTCPTLFSRNSIAKSFAKRALINGFVCFVCLSVTQYDNLFAKSVCARYR